MRKTQIMKTPSSHTKRLTLDLTKDRQGVVSRVQRHLGMFWSEYNPVPLNDRTGFLYIYVKRRYRWVSKGTETLKPRPTKGSQFGKWNYCLLRSLPVTKRRTHGEFYRDRVEVVNGVTNSTRFQSTDTFSRTFTFT